MFDPNCDIVEETEAHRMVGHGMMPRRTDGAKHMRMIHHCAINSGDNCTSGSDGSLPRMLIGPVSASSGPPPRCMLKLSTWEEVWALESWESLLEVLV